MKFVYEKFSCDVDIFRQGDDIIVRFYNGQNEPAADEIVNLVFVDPGYGYLQLKCKGEHEGLLSGFLDESWFVSEEMVDAAIAFIESLSPHSHGIYLPYHVARFKRTDYVEYNGEY